MEETFQLDSIYKVGGTGKLLIWKIGFDGEMLITQYGNVDDDKDNNLRVDMTEVILNNSNRTLYEQAMLEAKSRMKKKLDYGYHLGKVSYDVISLPSMLCNKWNPDKNQIKRWPVWVEPKLDGVRCRVYIEEDKVVLISRNNLKICNFNSLRTELYCFSLSLINILKDRDILPIFKLDGELYSDKISFDQLSGIVRLKNDKNDLEDVVNYNIFDVVLPIDLTYDERYEILNEVNITSDRINLIEPMEADNKEDIIDAHNYYVNEGYEGVIIRKIGGDNEMQRKESYYKGNRCNNLLKYKMFNDEEGTIIDSKCGKGREKDAIIWIIEDDRGNVFSLRPKGTIEDRKIMYKDKDKYIGLRYKYRFQGLDEDRKPRFAVGLGFDDK